MTTFFATLRIFHGNTPDPAVVNVEVPAIDLPQAVHMLGAFKAGLAAHPQFSTGMEESLAAKPTRGQKYLTMREAANWLRNNVFS